MFSLVRAASSCDNYPPLLHCHVGNYKFAHLPGNLACYIVKGFQNVRVMKWQQLCRKASVCCCFFKKIIIRGKLRMWRNLKLDNFNLCSDGLYKQLRSRVTQNGKIKSTKLSYINYINKTFLGSFCRPSGPYLTLISGTWVKRMLRSFFILIFLCIQGVFISAVAAPHTPGSLKACMTSVACRCGADYGSVVILDLTQVPFFSFFFFAMSVR